MIEKSNGFKLNFEISEENKNKLFVFISLFFFLFIIYHNSFNGEWIFDDYSNILDNRSIQIKSLSPEALKNVWTQEDGRKQLATRPIAYLSFALNYYIGGFDVFGYHIVNFLIHFMSAVFLFLFIYNTLKLPCFSGYYDSSACAIATLSAFLWASSPVNVNAVTYIVQRMTSLAGMLYIICLYTYMKFRTSEAGKARWAYMGLCCTLFVAAILTKENSAMLLVAIPLYEFCFFNWDTSRGHIKYLIMIMAPLLFIAIGSAYLGVWHKFLKYDIWTFTLQQRLLTEPAVILYYISLLIYPLGSRLSLEHDFPIFRGLFEPWYALAPTLIIVLIIITLLFVRKRHALISYCLLFFFLNHVIEGSVIPIDIIFEHRNYVPSMLFFVPFAILMVNILDYFSYRKTLQFIFTGVFFFLLIAQGHTVYMRNDLFRFEKQMWADTVKKNPDLSRPHAMMSVMLVKENDFKGAFEESRLAIEKNNYPNLYNLSVYEVNMGSAMLNCRRDYDSALIHFEKAVQLGNYTLAYNGISMVMLAQGKFEQALKYIELAVKHDPNNRFSVNYPLTLLKLGFYNEAIEWASAIMIKSRRLEEKGAAYSIIAEAEKQKGNYKGAALFWGKVLKLDASNIQALSALVEIYDHEQEIEKLNETIFKFLYIKGSTKLSEVVYSEIKEENFSAHKIELDILEKILRKQLKRIENDF